MDESVVVKHHVHNGPPTLCIPPLELCGMEYKTTGFIPLPKLVYIGIRVFKDLHSNIHTALHDCALHYPVTILFYPNFSSATPHHQPTSVLIGRFEATKRACLHISDFKLSIANILSDAIHCHCPCTLR
eukprot:TRINITY_DN6552_c0_g1_i1.p1 TRINITY_DN6552_c0_g1~~TRINITY_DN6552_c0_g1_i1.p1  ORF type:complete len:129 (-),score=26.98 TRINITY_DN6552_c0_g1_i1:5-391(-)